MKKAKLLCLSMLAAMVLTGCGGAKASFKDNTVEKELEQAEVDLLVAQVKNNLKAKLSGYTLKTSQVDKTDISETVQESDDSFTFYDGYYVHEELVEKSEQKVNGLTIKTEDKTIKDFFKYNDDYIVTYSVKNGEEATFTPSKVKGEEVYANGLQKLMQLFNGVTGYEDSKGNRIFISNNYAENFNAVQFGNDTKVVHTINKNQTVIKVDKNNLIDSYYVYQSQETNRDPDTNEIKNKVSLVSESKTSGEFSYKTRKENSKGYSAIKEEIQNKNYWIGEPSLKAKNGDTNIAIQSDLDSKRLSYSKYEYFSMVTFQVGAAPLNENGKQISFTLEGSLKKFATDGDPAATVINVANVDLAGKVDMTVKQQVKLAIRFVVELTGDKTVNNVSDVAVYLL